MYNLPRLAVLAVIVQLSALALRPAPAAEIERIEVSPDKRHFILVPSGKPFTPWGFNYDHDEKGRLLEDYWETEWPKVEADFREMRDLKANVVRIHLQFGKFMTAADKPNEKALAQLAKLLKLAEETGLYLDLTGLGCYHKQDVPAWYDALAEEARWAAQANFWSAVAKTCAASPAVFCYDLMNEPVSPAGSGKSSWLGPPLGDKHFVQRISLDQRERPRPEVAQAWIATLCRAIRAVDAKHLITVGLVDWSLDRPGLTSGFVPAKIAGELDFVCVHLYPQAGKIKENLETLAGFQIGKPVVIEETFPLKCSAKEFDEFLTGSAENACGWIGFYWGATVDDYRREPSFTGALMTAWLERFAKGPPEKKK